MPKIMVVTQSHQHLRRRPECRRLLETDIPTSLELDMFDPGLWLIHPQDLVGLGGDGRNIRVDHLYAIRIGDWDVQEPQPRRRLQLEQFPHRRVKWLAHRHTPAGRAR
jgi:hypothetical protein